MLLGLCDDGGHAGHEVGVGLERRLHVHHAVLLDHRTDGRNIGLVGLGRICPFRPRPGFDENRSGDRPPFRPRPRFDENQPESDNYYHFQDEEEMGGEESAPPSFEERRPHTPHRSFNNKKNYRSRRDKDSDDGFRRPRRPFRGGRQSRDNGYSSDDED